jgi:hypothetical protein
MAKFELNIYGENDAILKTYSTDVIRWKLFMEAVALQEKIKNEDVSVQIESVSAFIKAVFVGLTDAELENADAFDIMNTFRQIVVKANAINPNGKNA